MLKNLVSFSLIFSSLFPIDCTLLPDYQTIDGDKVFDLAGYAALVGQTKFKDAPFGALDYNEEAIGAFYHHYLNEKNIVTFGLGYSRQYLRWKQNPAFSQKVFNDAIFQISLTSFYLESWRWIVDVGAHVNLNHFNLLRNAFYTQLLWGRYQHLENLGVHIGFAGQAGVSKAKYLPLLGLDWYFHPQFSIVAVYPAEAALNYHINRDWKLSMKYRSFAGWYHAFHRVGSNEPLPKSIFTIESTGLDIGIYLDKSHLRFYLFGGYNLGGWLLIEDSEGSDGKYYHFKGAPYGAIKAGLTF
jgi:hypothetical protein